MAHHAYMAYHGMHVDQSTHVDQSMHVHQSMHGVGFMHEWEEIGSGEFVPKNMAHFEQAALLATAWANDVEVKTMALNHSIVQVSANKKLRRSRVLSTWCLLYVV